MNQESQKQKRSNRGDETGAGAAPKKPMSIMEEMRDRMTRRNM